MRTRCERTRDAQRKDGGTSTIAKRGGGGNKSGRRVKYVPKTLKNKWDYWRRESRKEKTNGAI